MISEMEYLQRAIDICGGVTALAGMLGVDQSTVSQWKLRKSVPPIRARDIEKATKGKVTKHQLCPAVFGK